MKELKQSISRLQWKAYRKAVDMKEKVADMCVKAVKNEDGDTNFISIAIILFIVIVVAIAFIGFKDSIITAVSGVVDNFVGRIKVPASPASPTP